MQWTTLVWLQSIVHVFCVTLHDVQPSGQPFAGASPRGASPFIPGASIRPGTTQKPLSQTVPMWLAQSAFAVHENSWLLWLTEHAVRRRITSILIGRPLIANLRR
jgi:hypothetical protein